MNVELWWLSVVILLHAGVLTLVHRRMTILVRLAIILPSLSLAFMYIILSIYYVEPTFRQNIGRIGLVILFIWQSILLWMTRKQHY